MSRTSKKGTGKIDFKRQILDTIRNHPGGLTITDIATIKSYSRNTVSKYVSVLELKDQIFSRKIGAYKLYFSSQTSFIPTTTALTYYKSLLIGLKEKFPNKEKIFKEIGRNQASRIDFDFGPKALKQLRSFKDHPISRVYFEVFKDFYPIYDVFQPNIEISVLNEDPVTKRAVFRFKNSVFLEDSEDYIYHIYIALGITEGVLSRQLKTDVECNVEKIYVSKNKGASYCDVSIQIKNNS